MSESDVGGIAGKKLASFIERIERLETEKSELSADIRDVYAEAKGNGFDTKIMRQVIKIRKMEPADRSEQDELLDLYKRALGMDGTPLGDFATRAEERATESEQVDIEDAVQAAVENHTDGSVLAAG